MRSACLVPIEIRVFLLRRRAACLCLSYPPRTTPQTPANHWLGRPLRSPVLRAAPVGVQACRRPAGHRTDRRHLIDAHSVPCRAEPHAALTDSCPCFHLNPHDARAAHRGQGLHQVHPESPRVATKVCTPRSIGSFFLKLNNFSTQDFILTSHDCQATNERVCCSVDGKSERCALFMSIIIFH